MLMTPYINTYYYKTELIFSRNIEKIKIKKEIEKMKEKNRETKNNNDSDNSVSLGIAVGIGVVGAFVAFKDKFF